MANRARRIAGSFESVDSILIAGDDFLAFFLRAVIVGLLENEVTPKYSTQ
jgi:hypothetical protein